jgi:hypothetical protein
MDDAPNAANNVTKTSFGMICRNAKPLAFVGLATEE